MTRGVWLLIIVFALLLVLAVWSLLDKDTTPSSLDIIPEKQLSRNRRIIAVGDSLTAGYRLSPEESFPSQLQDLLSQAWFSIEVINAGKSGDTSSQIRDRFNRSLSDAQTGDIILLCAGANDGLQWLSIEQLETNLRWMIETAQEQWIVVILAGMQIPPNYGASYSSAFASLYPRLAKDYSVLLYPFLLEWVAADPSLNLDDGIHPNKQWYMIIAKNLFDFLEEKWVISK